ncbi:MAG: NlpC/P60 family protein [Clostridium sp.]|uniref:C40 family peptidase n=1 Tax=Clostridium sp. TaxID=1506 RepID=UPI003EE6D3FA
MKKKLLVAVIFAVTMITTPMFTNMNAFADTVTQVQSDKAAQQQKALEAQEQLEKLDNQIQNTMIKSKQLDSQIASANANIQSYQNQISQTQAKLNTEKQKMDNEIAGLYKAGYANNGLLAYLNAIFTGNSFSQIVTNLEDVHSINQANQKTLNEIKEQEATLKNQEASLQSNVKTLQESKSQVASNLAEQQGAKQKEQSILSTAQANVAADSAQEIAMQKAKVQKALQEDAAKAATSTSKSTSSSSNTAASSTSSSSSNTAVSSTSSNSSNSSSSNVSNTGGSSSSSSSSSATVQQSNNSQASGSAQAIISYGEQFIGVPYVWGGESPSGFDCSGLMQYIFGHNGVSLPRTAAAQQECGTPVAKGDLQPGDLVFWGDPAYHVAVYIGGGQILVAPHTGAYVTVMNLYPYTNARRVL